MEVMIGVVVGFGCGFLCAAVPLFCGVWWLLRRIERIQDQRDSVAVQLAAAMLELRTDAVLEMVVEGDGGAEDEDENDD